MKRVETTVHIPASPDCVWRVLVDFASYPRWSPRLTVSGRPERGARLRVTAAAPGQKGMSFSPVVLAAEPGRALRWRGRVLLPGICDGVHEFLLSPDGGGTCLVHAENFTGVMTPFMGKALPKLAGEMREQNAALLRRVEEYCQSA